MSYSSSVSIIINASPEKIWEALTVPEKVKEYFFGTNLVTDWKVGSPILFRGEWEGKAYEDKGTVLEFNPPHSLSFNYWSNFNGLEDKEELYQILRYEILEVKDGINDGVKVTINQSNVDTQERADHSAKNWKMVLEGLKKLVENN